jgi:hypothetical protein
LLVKVHRDTKAEWHQLAVLADARDFYRGDGRGACRQLVERMIRAETSRVRADLERMGQDPDAILTRRGIASETDPESDLGYSRANPILSDPD